jgi:hypothetical protein
MSVLSAILWALSLATAVICGLMLVGWSHAQRPLWQKWLAWSGYFAALSGLLAFGLGAAIPGVLAATLLGGPLLAAIVLLSVWWDTAFFSHISRNEALEKRRFKRVPPRDLGAPQRDD